MRAVKEQRVIQQLVDDARTRGLDVEEVLIAQGLLWSPHKQRQIAGAALEEAADLLSGLTVGQLGKDAGRSPLDTKNAIAAWLAESGKKIKQLKGTVD